MPGIIKKIKNSLKKNTNKKFEKKFLKENMSDSEVRIQLYVRVQEIDHQLKYCSYSESETQIRRAFLKQAAEASKITDNGKQQELYRALLLKCDNEINRYDARQTISYEFGYIKHECENSIGMTYEKSEDLSAPQFIAITEKGGHSRGGSLEEDTRKIVIISRAAAYFENFAKRTKYDLKDAGRIYDKLLDYRKELNHSQSGTQKMTKFIKGRSEVDKIIDRKMDVMIKRAREMCPKEPKKSFAETVKNKLTHK